MIAKLRIAVLAAGYSRRMGCSKALLRVAGTSLLRRTLETAADISSSPVLVIAPPALARYRFEARGLNVRFVINALRVEGLASSVRCAVWHARYSRALLLIPVDLAGLKHRDLLRLVSVWRARPRLLTARRIAGYGGTPLLLPQHLYARALTIRGDQGLKGLLENAGAQERRFISLPSAAFDVDTPTDLAQARRARGLRQLTSASAGRS